MTLPAAHVPAPAAPAIDLSALTDAVCAALRDRLSAAGYDPAIIAFGESVAPGAFDRVRLPLAHLALERRGDPAARLALLFAYGAAVARAEVLAALGDDAGLLAALERAGLVAPADAGRVKCDFRLMPLDALYILSDELANGADVVMGPGPTTVELANWMPAELAGAAVLDVGCGAGTLALVAAHHGAARAVGVDLNPRAVDFARFNARLNGLADRTAFAAGDLCAPVAGQRFDVAVAQPPFIARPPDAPAVVFLHGGAHGDELALRLLGELPGVLAPGGRAIVLFDSVVQPNAPLQARVRAALRDAPVDLLLFTAPGLSVDAQAIGYAAMQSPALDDAFAAAARTYRDHLRALGATELTRALAVLRAPMPGRAGEPKGPSFAVSVPVSSGRRADAAALAARLAALDVAAGDDAGVLRARVGPAPGARYVEEYADPSGRTAHPRRTVRFAPGALVSDAELSEAMWALHGALDESATVAEAVARYAEVLEGATADGVRAQVVRAVREGLARGVLALRETG